MEAMEASLANPKDEKEIKRTEAEQLANERYERHLRLVQSDLINSIQPQVAKMVSEDRLKETVSLDIVRRWFGTDKPYLFLTGPTGVGKTIAGAWMIANHGGIYVRAQMLERAGLAIFGPYEELLQRVHREKIVFIDDLGTEFRVAEFTAVLGEIINNRQGGRLRTLFTSNLTDIEIEEKYFGVRELSRLKDSSYFISDDSDDMRASDANSR